jgi:hypothetical protein
MAKYRISGIWNEDGVINNYAIHKVENGIPTVAVKVSMDEAIMLVENQQNTVTTYLWNYQTAKWNIGEPVHVVNGENGKYLRSNPDDKLTDNLGHLIDYDWIRN